jgi:hypothetical protein
MKTIIVDSTTVAITIGKGGAAATNGGDTSFGNLVVAAGGVKGGNASTSSFPPSPGSGGIGGINGEAGADSGVGGKGADGFMPPSYFGDVEISILNSNANGNGYVAIGGIKE